MITNPNPNIFHLLEISSQESSITNPQEAEWLKYSSYWPDPDNPDHHG